MVSRIAVIALVLIVACPILIGYGMNLEETTYSNYESNNDPVNVTPLLNTGTAYSYAHADVNLLNTNFYYKATNDSNITSQTIPRYVVGNTSTKTSINVQQIQFNGNTPGTSGATWNFSGDSIQELLFTAKYTPNETDYLKVKVSYSGNQYQWTLRAFNVHFDYATKTASVCYYQKIDGIYFDYINKYTNVDEIHIEASTAQYSAISELSMRGPAYPNDYIDISKGYRLGGNNFDPITYVDNTGVYTDLPEHPKNVLLTVDLSTISDSTYMFTIGVQHMLTPVLRFEKTTDGDGVHWKVYTGRTSTVLKAELYYDVSRSSNTYQIYLDTYGGSLRYVGDWPTLIGPANYYRSFEFDWYPSGNPISEDLGELYFFERTPVMRIDDSEYRAFTYQIIENKAYAPSQFKTYPSTKISDIGMYGSSITFGGNTYTVTDGKITIGSHQVPVKDMVLSSVPSDNGYDNKIGNTVISTTAQPSNITFNGKWSAVVTTTSMSEKTVTKTEWTPGQFGWDGIDTNFLLVAMFTSLAAFIGLGIYARRHGGGVIPLMIICGGAAVLFFCMI